MKKFPFLKKMRLLNKEDFARMQKAQKLHSYSLFCFVLPNQLPYNRLGLAVSKKIGKAPIRNRVKRILREAFRLTQPLPSIPQGYDILLVPKRGEIIEFQDVSKQLVWLFKKIHSSYQTHSPKKGITD